MSGVIVKDDESAKALHKLAREQMKCKLLTDIRIDIEICRIEGWDYHEYLRDIHEIIAHFDPCEVSYE